MATPSQFDNDTFQLARDHLQQFVKKTAEHLRGESGRLLEVGPQDRSLVRESFHNFAVETFDIVDTYGPDLVGDITKVNTFIPDSAYDVVVCMEVIEHTLNPFDAVKEIRRVLKDGGHLLISAPLNWRIHGPSPDCWRITEHGWNALLRDFDIVEIDILESPGRELFPIRYNVLARCNKAKQSQDNELQFRWI
ncbi:methyltransferase domain-containing protein [Pseudomonas sp. GD03842]|uniref:class I SAM-dependent methyltransferase n=1 Tax=unclassified Pseudomonas TaxID=196821 RepID=UPI000D35250C|nr:MULTISPECIES: methyltransferase domain-containing protein [unclassified Pseudomonas]MDH0749776.1 methyltransferase domain-containing protein [Pseudomonas sp. GD03842]RAU38681.1 methyltransferase domain-containing protein [Pseudomonas sp. RIT 409]RAU45345.1 methyltransferase domain-containing protein [Pseudomonas sp. RIT 412]